MIFLNKKIHKLQDTCHGTHSYQSHVQNFENMVRTYHNLIWLSKSKTFLLIKIYICSLPCAESFLCCPSKIYYFLADLCSKELSSFYRQIKILSSNYNKLQLYSILSHHLNTYHYFNCCNFFKGKVLFLLFEVTLLVRVSKMRKLESFC